MAAIMLMIKIFNNCLLKFIIINIIAEIAAASVVFTQDFEDCILFIQPGHFYMDFTSFYILNTLKPRLRGLLLHN